jgi:hypothetical protein
VRIRCIRLTPTTGLHAPSKLIHGQVQQSVLQVGKSYVVYALEVRDGRAVYWIEDEARTAWPTPYDASLFSMESGQPSSLWDVDVSYRSDASIWFAPREWLGRAFFMDKLTDGEAAMVEIYASTKAFMDMEFHDPAVSVWAKMIDHEWLQCPHCSDAWRELTTVALVKCPSCFTLLRNPRFRSARSDV